MAEAEPTPIAGFDITSKGKATAAPDTSPVPIKGAAYRWLHFDMSDPALEEWMGMHLPEIAAMAMLQVETRPRTQVMPEGILINMRAINMNAGDDLDDMVSLRLWVTAKLVVTARFRRVFSVDEIRKTAMEGTAPSSPTAFIAKLSHRLTNRIEAESVALEDETDAIEDALLDGKEPDPNALTVAKRKVIRIRRYILPMRDALHALGKQTMTPNDAHQRGLLLESANRMDRSVEEIISTGDRLLAVSDQLDAINAAKISRNSYILSIFAAIFLPLGFLTGLFGMNVAGLPWADWQPAFLTLSAIMALIGVGLFLLFRLMKWF